MELLGFLDRAGHAVGTGGEHDLGAIGGRELAALDAHGLWHGEDEGVTARRRQHGETDARVTAGGLDDGAARGERAVLLGRIEHGTGDAVLDGAAGIRSLVFAQDGGGGALGEGRQVDERGLADERIDMGGELHGDPLPGADDVPGPL